MGRYEAVLFDFDGVLVDSEPVHYECWREVLGPFGIRLEWDDYCRSCIGVADREMIEMLCRLCGRPDLFDAVWAEYPRKKELFRGRMAEHVPMPAETREAVLALEGYRLAVVSSSGRTEVEPSLVLAGVRPAFAAVVTREDVARLKPAPDPYWKAAELLGVRRALVVEDSDAGVESGRAAGFDVLRVGSAAETARLLAVKLAAGSAD